MRSSKGSRELIARPCRELVTPRAASSPNSRPVCVCVCMCVCVCVCKGGAEGGKREREGGRERECKCVHECVSGSVHVYKYEYVHTHQRTCTENACRYHVCITCDSTRIEYTRACVYT